MYKLCQTRYRGNVSGDVLVNSEKQHGKGSDLSQKLFPSQNRAIETSGGHPLRTRLSSRLSKEIITVVIFVVLIILLCPMTVVSQSTVGVLHGSVQDSRGRAVPGATVSIGGTGVSAVTNEKGDFTIRLASQVKEQVTVTAPG